LCSLISPSPRRLPGALGRCIQWRSSWSRKGFIWQVNCGYYDSLRSTGMFRSGSESASFCFSDFICIWMHGSCQSHHFNSYVIFPLNLHWLSNAIVANSGLCVPYGYNFVISHTFFSSLPFFVRNLAVYPTFGSQPVLFSHNHLPV
jgi:hypothetical protein